MKIIKNVGHWIAFLLGAYLGTWIYWGLLTLIPLFLGLWIISLSDFLFILVGGLCVSLYYLLTYGLGFYIAFLNKMKPDYWISSLFILFMTFYFFYTLINRWELDVNIDLKLFLNFNGIIYAILIIPAYLRIFFMSLLFPFIKEYKNKK